MALEASNGCEGAVDERDISVVYKRRRNSSRGFIRGSFGLTFGRRASIYSWHQTRRHTCDSHEIRTANLNALDLNRSEASLILRSSSRVGGLLTFSLVRWGAILSGPSSSSPDAIPSHSISSPFRPSVLPTSGSSTVSSLPDSTPTGAFLLCQSLVNMEDAANKKKKYAFSPLGARNGSPRLFPFGLMSCTIMPVVSTGGRQLTKFHRTSQ